MVENLAKKYWDYVNEIRKKLHQYPEIGFNEIKTSTIIRNELKKIGIEYSECAKTGTVALIKGKSEGKTILLRADIDALPIKEKTNLPFSSLNDGFMHACGHDIHTACLLGAAKILYDLKDSFCGNVKLVFQPAEETTGGAMPMIEAGVMENPHVDAAFALHVEPLEKCGNIQIRDGAIMACPDEFTITIKGKGGHGSAPKQCINPIMIASEIAKEYEGVVKKYIDPSTPCVVSICSMHSGTCPNVIPETAILEGTLRALDNKTRFYLAEILENIAKEISKKSGGDCDFEYRALYPPVINDTKMNGIVIKAAKKLSFINKIINLPCSSMAGDDFSYFAEMVPSSYFRLGVGNNKISAPIHSPEFDADENSLKYGMALMAQIAIKFLES